MIRLSDLFIDLASSELASTALVSNNTISSPYYTKIISHLNAALRDLYTRFNLSERFIYVHQQTGVTRYFLRSEYMGTVRDMGEECYILYEEDNLFSDNIIKIHSVYDEDNELLSINNKTSEYSVFTPELDILEMEPSDPIQVVRVEYKATHPLLKVTDGFDPSKVDLECSNMFNTALQLYTAAKELKSIKTGSGTNQNQVQPLWMQYERECMQLANSGMFVGINEAGQRFSDNGWA